MLKKYVNKIKYLSYYTVYSATGDRNNNLTNRVCFAEILNRGKIRKEHYEIYLFRDINQIITHSICNFCFLTEVELRKHINLARRLFPFKYSIEPAEYNHIPSFKVVIDLNADHFYHRYLLTWIRYAYEFPYNLILNDALHMKHSYLNRESITNLFVLCANSYRSDTIFYGSGHAISCLNSTFLKEYELKNKIVELANKEARINDIYPRSSCKLSVLPYNENSKYIEYWTNNQDFEDRAHIYLQNYKLLKKEQ